MVHRREQNHDRRRRRVGDFYNVDAVRPVPVPFNVVAIGIKKRADLAGGRMVPPAVWVGADGNPHLAASRRHCRRARAAGCLFSASGTAITNTGWSWLPTRW